jgi:phosphoinositide-3-kinase regulatory subunit 4
MEELVEMFAEQASTILVDPSSDVKRAALANVSQLCLAFGRTKTNEVLLSRMITYLNDKDWRLRSAFLEKIVSVAAFVGSTSLEEFVLPLMEQALAGEYSIRLRIST